MINLQEIERLRSALLAVCILIDTKIESESEMNTVALKELRHDLLSIPALRSAWDKKKALAEIPVL